MWGCGFESCTFCCVLSRGRGTFQKASCWFPAMCFEWKKKKKRKKTSSKVHNFPQTNALVWGKLLQRCNVSPKQASQIPQAVKKQTNKQKNYFSPWFSSNQHFWRMGFSNSMLFPGMFVLIFIAKLLVGQLFLDSQVVNENVKNQVVCYC